MSLENKERSHARIVGSASRLLRERGIDGVGIAVAMSAAGLTHGGFYKHFDSKDALVDSALSAAFAEIAARLEGGDPEAFARYRALYLTREHVDHPGLGCPVAALGQDVGRGPAALKATFGRGVRRLFEAAAVGRRGSARARQTAAIRELCMLVGAVVVARASDPETADEVLSACRTLSPGAAR